MSAPIPVNVQVNPTWHLARMSFESSSGTSNTNIIDLKTIQLTSGDQALPFELEKEGLNRSNDAAATDILYSIAPYEPDATPIEDLYDSQECALYESPLSKTKIFELLASGEVETRNSKHLQTTGTPKQDWTYVADFSVHRLTPNAPANYYYLHARISAANKLEFAFFTQKETSTAISSEFALASLNKTVAGSSSSISTDHLLRGAQKFIPLRIATKEEAEAKMFVGDGTYAIKKSMQPKCLGALMVTGNQCISSLSTPDRYGQCSGVAYMLRFFGHIWTYWGTIIDGVLYIVGVPEYTGEDNGSVFDFRNGSISNNYPGRLAGNLPPTYLDLSFSYTQQSNTIEDAKGTLRSETQSFREAFDRVFPRKPYTWGTYPGAGGYQRPFWDGSRLNLSALLDLRVKDSKDSSQYELAHINQGAITHMTCGHAGTLANLSNTRGGIYRNTSGNLQSAGFLDDDTSTTFGHVAGVTNIPVENTVMPFLNKISGVIVSRSTIPTYVATATTWGDYTDRKENGFHVENSGMWSLQTINAQQRGLSYDIWTSCCDAAFTLDNTVDGIASGSLIPALLTDDQPEMALEALSTDLLTRPGSVWSYAFWGGTGGGGGSSIDPSEPIPEGYVPTIPIDPDAEDVPEGTTNPIWPVSPDEPDDPNDPNSEWERSVTSRGYYYVSGSGVTVKTLASYGTQPFYEFGLQAINISGSFGVICETEFTASINPSGGSYVYGSLSYSVAYAVEVSGSAVTARGYSGVTSSSSIGSSSGSASVQAPSGSVSYNVTFDSDVATSSSALSNPIYSVTYGSVYTRKITSINYETKKITYQELIRTTVSLNRSAVTGVIVSKVNANMPALTPSPTQITGTHTNGTAPTLSVSITSSRITSPAASEASVGIESGTITAVFNSSTLCTVAGFSDTYDYGADHGSSASFSLPSDTISIQATTASISP